MKGHTDSKIAVGRGSYRLKNSYVEEHADSKIANGGGTYRLKDSCMWVDIQIER